MCGIFAYVGNKNASEQIINGLKRLEYRGYDSWGVAVQSENAIHTTKQVGKISDVTDLDELPHSTIGIGHTRWATHGGVTHANAHPHYSTDKSFVLAQNGIVQNYTELKTMLVEKGYTFQSETDTEVIVRLIEEKLKTLPDLRQAVRAAFLDLEGRNTIILLRSDKKEIIAARNGSPLVVGVNDETNELYLSSDTLSFAPYVSRVIVVENGQMVHYCNEAFHMYSIIDDKEITYQSETVQLTDSKVDKEGYDHFMIKEIFENPFVVKQVTKQPLEDYNSFAADLKKAPHIYTIASGTAGIAAAQIAFYLRKFGKMQATSLIGADAAEYIELFNEGDILISPSQSGETADVLEVLEIAKKKGVKIASYVNMQGSSMTRLSDYKFMSQAGPEICVMSTKVYTSQVAWGYAVAKAVEGKIEEGNQNLLKLSEAMTHYLADDKNHEAIKNLAKQLVQAKDIFLIGKAQNLQIIREGMVKLIEGTYKHAHAIPAGDLKHYAITLMEKGIPVIVALSHDEVKSDVLNAAHEIKARGATVIGIGSDKNEGFDTYLQVPESGETSAIMNIVPLQLLSYYMTVELGNNVDKPRNIAKSVTVK